LRLAANVQLFGAPADAEDVRHSVPVNKIVAAFGVLMMMSCGDAEPNNANIDGAGAAASSIEPAVLGIAETVPLGASAVSTATSVSTTTLAPATTPVPTTVTTTTVSPPTTIGRRTSLAAEAGTVELDYDPERLGVFHPIGRVGDLVTIRSGPGLNFDEIGTHIGGLLTLHAGTVATDATGEQWINIAESAGKIEIGWVHARTVGRAVSSLVIQAGDATRPPASHPGGYESGVDIEAPSIVGIGCDMFQLGVRSAASHEKISSHVLISTKRPTTPRSEWEDPHWDMGDDAQLVYIRPTETITVTVPAHEPTTYFFLPLDNDGSARTLFDFNGDPVLDEDGNLTAAGVHEVTVEASCEVEQNS
jgi:hypothetical protein